MSGQARVVLCRIAAGLSVAVTVVSLTVLLTVTDPSLLLTEGGAFALFAIFFGAVTWVVVPRQPGNRVVWILSGTALGSSLYVAGWTVAAAIDPQVIEQSSEILVPAELDPMAAWALLIAIPIGTAGVLGLLTFGLLLFPDGTLPSPRWRWVAVLDGVAIAVTVASSIFMFRPSNTESTTAPRMGWVVDVLVVVAVLLSVAALARRFRDSSGELRQQLKWILWGASTLVVSLGILIQAQGTNLEEPMLALFAFAGLAFVVAYAVALGKYRLHDIDVVISRTFVYGTLAVFITVVYVGAVVGVGRLIGSGDEPNPVLAIGATAVVAVAFQPLRRLLQTTANRLVYGRRATPYEVLSTFSQGVAAVDPRVLTQIAGALVEGTTAEAAGVWMNRDTSLQLMAQWPPEHAFPKRTSAIEGSAFEHVADVVHDGESLGLVTLSLRPGQPFSPVDTQLLEQVAAGLGLALRNLRLTEDLRDRIDQLRDSRRRIVAVQDMTRRRLERDLHDGAQQRLVSMKIKLGIGSSMAAKAGLDEVREVLDTLRSEADEAIEAVRDFARGIYPPLLEAEGLGAALKARAHKIPLAVTVQAAGVARYPRELEAAVYFCVLECLQNAVRHSEARSVLVTVSDDEDALSFEVRDDGVGFDVGQTLRGAGLANIADRLDALDGALEVTSRPGKGTVVRGVIPTRQLVVTG